MGEINFFWYTILTIYKEHFQVHLACLGFCVD